MTKLTSPATNQRYPLALICKAWGVGRSTVYDHRARQEADRPPARRRGPPGPHPDDVLVERIRAVLAASPFHGEGYRKVWARLRHAGIRTSKERVRRLMREHGLRAPYFPKRERGSKAHDGRITTDRPDEMWGTDATATLTGEGSAFIFFVVDHCTSECMGIHASASGSRQEALEPLRQGVRRAFGTYDQQAADGLALRHDHGSQFMSHDYQRELAFLGIRTTPSFVAEPECNGVAERFVHKLKEQLLWTQTFETIEELRLALHRFMHDHNSSWLVQKHDYATPQQVRNRLTQSAAIAA